MERDLRQLEFHGDAELDFDALGFIVLSSVLACVALLTSSVPVLIGAMILAPSFDTLIALPFGILNKDWQLVRKGAINSLVLFGLAFAVCLGTTWVFVNTALVPAHPDFARREMVTERLIVAGHSVVVALTAGAGGALASAADRQSNLVGVVVALALVPALAAASIGFLEATAALSGWGGIGLFAVNVGGIIAAGLIVLLIRRATGDAETAVRRNRRVRRR